MTSLNSLGLHKQQSGFTLLEVIVALTITGFILGGLFSLVGGSKQLSWRSEASLLKATKLRAVTNFALLENEYSEVEPILEDTSFDIRPSEYLELPERITQPSTLTLQEYEILSESTGEIITGNRWVRLELPR